MNQSLPSPDDILAELADTVVSSIDTRALASFETNLAELVTYHRFLIEAYTGEKSSFADLEDSWRPIHRDWLSPYRQIIERAIAMLDDEPGFFSAICYLPGRLSRGYLDTASRSMQHAIMGLASLIVFRLEKRFTKKAASLGMSPENGILLKGSDRSTHEDAVIDLVGAWEAFRHWGEPERADGSAELRWQRIAKSWDFLGEHLALTADAFVTAAWNGDAIGAGRFRDMLVRWRDTFGLGINRLYLRESEFLNIDLIHMEWGDALDAVRPALTGFHDDAITPEGLYLQIVENAHKHAILVSAGVLVRWVLADRAGVFALSEARALIVREIADGDEGRLGHADHLSEFREFWRHLVAMNLAGTYHDGGQHSGFLDHLASSLDRVSERKVTVGRGYTPSTVHDRSGLTSAFWILASALLPDAAPHTLQWTKDILAAAGAAGDRKSTDKLRWMFRDLKDAGLSADVASPLIAALSGQTGADRAGFATFIGELQAYMEQAERERIISAAIDPATFDTLREAVWMELRNARAARFTGMKLSFQERGPLTFKRRFNLDKSALLQIRGDSAQITPFIARAMAAGFTPRPWWEFRKRQRPSRKTASEPTQKRFWDYVLRLAAPMAQPTGLWLPQTLIDGFEAAYPEDERSISGLVPIRDLEKMGWHDGYAFSLGTLHVYGYTGDVTEIILFSESALAEVDFGSNAFEQVALEILPVPDDPLKVVLECTVSYGLRWEEMPSYRIRIPADGSTPRNG